MPLAHRVLLVMRSLARISLSGKRGDFACQESVTVILVHVHRSPCLPLRVDGHCPALVACPVELSALQHELCRPAETNASDVTQIAQPAP